MKKKPKKQEKSKRVAVVRGGEWDTTQAVPRVVHVLLELGYEVTVLCWDTFGEGAPVEHRERFTIFRYRRRTGRAGVKYFAMWPLWWIWLLSKFLKGRYDIVHVMNLDTVIPAVISKVICWHKIVYDIRDAWGLCLTNQPFPIPQIFTLLDKIFTIFVDGLLLSQGDLTACADYFGSIACRKVPVVQVLNVPQSDLGKNYRKPSTNPLTINFSGRISALRGAYLLADCIEGERDIRLHVYGKLNDPKVKERYDAMENVVFEEKVPYEQAIQYMDKADLVSLLYDPALKVVFISSANKMFEAMMLGKPYICTKGSYPAQVAERFKLGWALPYGDKDALKNLLKTLVKNPEMLVKAGENGRKAYEKYFRWEHQKKNLVALYRYLSGEKGIVTKQSCGWNRLIGEVST